MGSESGMSIEMWETTAEQSKEVLACNKIEIELKGTRDGTLRA